MKFLKIIFFSHYVFSSWKQNKNLTFFSKYDHLTIRDLILILDFYHVTFIYLFVALLDFWSIIHLLKNSYCIILLRELSQSKQISENKKKSHIINTPQRQLIPWHHPIISSFVHRSDNYHDYTLNTFCPFEHYENRVIEYIFYFWLLPLNICLAITPCCNCN